MDTKNFISISQAELDAAQPTQNTVLCKGGCGKVVEVHSSTAQKADGTPVPGSTLEYIRCECKGVSFVVGINGKEWH